MRNVSFRDLGNDFQSESHFGFTWDNIWMISNQFFIIVYFQNKMLERLYTRGFEQKSTNLVGAMAKSFWTFALGISQ